MDRRVYRTLCKEMQMSERTISRLFKNYLNQAPEIPVKSKSHVHLIIDGTYLPNGLCIILYYNYDIRYVQLYHSGTAEKLREITQDLKALKSLSVQLYSVTCDGHRSILKVVKKIYPNTIIQRCLIHVKRQCGLYLSRKPKLQESKELLIIVNRLTAKLKHLKEKLLLHSGLRLEAKRNFIKWYLYFKNSSK